MGQGTGVTKRIRKDGKAAKRSPGNTSKAEGGRNNGWFKNADPRINRSGPPPTLAELRSHCRLSSPAIMERLDTIIAHGAEQNAIRAGEIKLHYGFGKPKENVELEVQAQVNANVQTKSEVTLDSGSLKAIAGILAEAGALADATEQQVPTTQADGTADGVPSASTP